MADLEDRAAIETARRLAHRVAHSNVKCQCPECTALRRVCTLATEALDMKAAKQRKKVRQRQINRGE